MTTATAVKAPKLTPEQLAAKVLNALPARKSEPSLTAQAIAAATGLPYSTVTQYLRQLAKDGVALSTRPSASSSRTAAVWRAAGKRPNLPKSKAVKPVPPARVPAAATNGRRARGGSASAAAPTNATAAKPVWVAVVRKGINHHLINGDHTWCGRPMHHGSIVDTPPDESPTCPKCIMNAGAPSESAAAASEPPAVPAAPVESPQTGSGGLAATIGFMEAARPVSAPPAPAPRARRTTAPAERELFPGDDTVWVGVFRQGVAYHRAPGSSAETGCGQDTNWGRFLLNPDAAVEALGAIRCTKCYPRREWARGELRDAVMAHLRGLPAGADASPGEIGTALDADTGPVGSNLYRMVKAATVIQTSTTPLRYRAA